MNTTGPASTDALQGFTDGVAERLTGTPALLGGSHSDRELAAIAWPGAEPWSELSPQECDEAIRRQLERDPNSNDTDQ